MGQFCKEIGLKASAVVAVSFLGGSSMYALFTAYTAADWL
jgi:hypothetical protein